MTPTVVPPPRGDDALCRDQYAVLCTSAWKHISCQEIAVELNTCGPILAQACSWIWIVEAALHTDPVALMWSEATATQQWPIFPLLPTMYSGHSCTNEIRSHCCASTMISLPTALQQCVPTIGPWVPLLSNYSWSCDLPIPRKNATDMQAGRYGQALKVFFAEVRAWSTPTNRVCICTSVDPSVRMFLHRNHRLGSH
jgi:hypothetical protein